MTGAARLVRRVLPPLLVLAFGIAVWQVLIGTFHLLPAYLLPAPSDIVASFRAQGGFLLQNTAPTLEIALAGYFLALALGLALAVLIRYSRVLQAAVYPIVIASQTVPVIALAPILVVLLGFTVVPKLIVVCLICFFPITVNAVDGFRSVDPDLIQLTRSLGAGRRQRFTQVEWPAALPAIFSGARVAITFSVVGALFGEWVGSSEGLGWVMIQAHSQFDTPTMFAAMVILTVLGLGLFALVAGLERLLLPWYHDERRAVLNDSNW